MVIGAAATVECMQTGDIEPLSIPRCPLDVLAQHTVAAAAMEDQVPQEVVKDRFDRLLKEVQEIAGEGCAVHQGTVQEVLVESVNDHDPSLMTGRMSNNLLVHFPGGEDLTGKLVQVRLDECRGFYYLGHMV